MTYSETPDFTKDVKALTKKVRTLPADLARVRLRIAPLYTPVKDVDLQTYRSLFFDGKRATILHQKPDLEIIKMRLDTDTATARGSLRLVFVAARQADHITFIEVYAKNNKPREDARRLKPFLR